MCKKFKNAFKSVALLFFLQVFVCCISKGTAIKCFVCDSSDNPSCADLSNSSIIPEECTLDKMKSLDTWLFDLNKFSYFENGANKNPLMNCQKVVARDPNSLKLVTARFCQLDTGDSDACDILRSKLRPINGIYNGQHQQEEQRRNSQRVYDMENNAQHTDASETEEDFFCDICKTDRCNGASVVTIGQIQPMLMLTVILMIDLLHRHKC